MSEKYFNHNSIRNAISAFGSLFTDFYVVRANKPQRVPIAYGPKHPFLSRIEETRDNPKIQMVLPRLAFEVSSISLDTEAQISKNSMVFHQQGQTMTRAYTPVKIGMNLVLIADNETHAWDLFEQIMERYSPTVQIRIEGGVDRSIQYKIPVNLSNTSFNIDYTGPLETLKKQIEITFSFEMKIRLFGRPISTDGNIVNEVIVNANQVDVEFETLFFNKEDS